MLIYNLLFARKSARNKNKTKPRLLFDSSARFVLQNTTAAQLQAISVPSYEAYLKWAKGANEVPVVDDLPTGGRLLWLGPRRSTKTVIYAHGKSLRVFVPPENSTEKCVWL